MNTSDSLLRDVQSKSFLAHDLLLYLDTHPDDAQALAAYRCALNDRLEAVRAYEQRVRALTPDGLHCRPDYDWADEPFPWQ